MNNAITNTAANAIAAATGGELIPMNNKGKVGSFARAIAFASREQRHAMGRAVYVSQLQNGQYRPIVRDAIELLVPKSARGFVESMVPASGAVSKAQFIAFCTTVHNFIKQKGKLKGEEKLFVYEIIRRCAEEATAHETVVDADEGLRRAA